MPSEGPGRPRKERLEGLREHEKEKGQNTLVALRLKPGDEQMLAWLAEQMGMSRGDVMRRAIAAYFGQINATIKK